MVLFVPLDFVADNKNVPSFDNENVHGIQHIFIINIKKKSRSILGAFFVDSFYNSSECIAYRSPHVARGE